MTEFLASSSDPTIASILLSAIGALTGVVTYLWRTFLKTVEEIKVKLADCEDDREDLWKALIAQNPSAEAVRKAK